MALVTGPSETKKLNWQIWVESPLQLLNAVEFAAAKLSAAAKVSAAAKLSAETTTKALIIPRAGAAQLAETVVALKGLGLPEGIEFAEPISAPVQTENFAIGDAFSGKVRKLLSLSKLPTKIALLDDGRQTLHLAELLQQPGSAWYRLGKKENLLMKILGARTKARLLKLAKTPQSLELFTIYGSKLPTSLEALGITISENNFSWLKSKLTSASKTTNQTKTAAKSSGLDRSVVLGTALLNDGYLRADSYYAWLSELAATGENFEYYPHRRQSELELAQITELGFEVVVTGLPVELALVKNPAKKIYTLPTTAVDTLKLIFADYADFELIEKLADRSWFQNGADQEVVDAYSNPN